jgi:(p)ppGpp synthase/HD superfamily hydrolase
MNINTAIAIAAKAHDGQTDKAGAPYIWHPIRIALGMKTDDERLAAILHDVVEDTVDDAEPVTIEMLIAAGLSGEALTAVRLLTKPKGADYQEYLKPIKEHEVARAVKLGDLADNMDITRLEAITDKDHSRLNRYFEAKAFLQSK